MERFNLYIKKTNLFIRIAGAAILFFLFTFSSVAQNGNSVAGKITGRVLDSLSGQPIEYATISLYSQSKNKLVNGTTADSKGIFKITDVSEGTYKIYFDFLGYKRSTKINVIVSKEKPNVNLRDINMSIRQTALGEVTVSADKILIENKIDKMVYHTDKDITSQSGVAADILKKVPEVSVDVDGNVELQGNSNIRFLINGKPSVLFGSNVADVLQSIPASQIENIEIITSPGAKYDAEGTGGIINIILKRSTITGINGNISLSGGTRLENSSLNLNVRKGKFGVHVFFSGNAQLLSTTVNNKNLTTQDSTGNKSQLLQTGNSDFNRSGYQSGIGFDWDITPHDNISGNFNYDYFGNSNTGYANSETLLYDKSGTLISDVNEFINTSNKFHEHSSDLDLGYKKKFKKEDQELEVLFNSSNGNIYSYYNQEQKYISNNYIFDSSYANNPGIENETNIEVNYTQPISENFKIETGTKTELDHINSKSDVYLMSLSTGDYDFSTSQSSSVDYKRTVNAAYLSATFKVFELMDIKTGIRDEYTQAKADFSNSGIVSIKPYNTIVPSMVISHTFKNRQTLKISYSHRIERPDYRDLNPFINASDPHNITTGNPDLHPEIGDKVELNYSQTFKNGATINPTIFYRGNRDDIQSYTTYYPTYIIGDSTYTNVAISTRENIGREDNFGISLFASVPATQKISLRTNISGFERYINTGMASGGNIHGFIYRINANASYQLSSTFIIELLGNFNSPKINAQGTMPSFTTYSFAFRKRLFNDKGSFAITATNFLYKYVNQKTELTGQNFNLSNTRQLPYRSIGFNFTYKFGLMEFKQEKEPEDINITNPPDYQK
ncbi:MAG: TonB-dependent receptor [Bacteroidia bacterium]|nr:TonB-dependent receptor [Bacteroidia bacterium]